jgi:Protein of unknown function DUF262
MLPTSELSQPTIISLPRLLRQIATGEYRIPRFQRPFVWKDEQRLLLLDSIKRGLPIGSILVWETSEHILEEHKRLGPFRLPRASAADVRSYVVDGHQRLVTLYSGLVRPDPSLGAHPEDDDGNDTGRVRWPIYYDLELEEFRLAHWSGRSPERCMNLPDMMDPAALYEFQKKLLANGLRRFAARAEGLTDRFKEYTIPVVVLHTEDFGIALDCFCRANGGTPMNETHMMSAVAPSSDFAFRRRIEQIEDGLVPLGWARMDEQVLMDALKVVSGELHGELPAYRTPEELLDLGPDPEQFLESIARVVKFLEERCGVFGPEALPHPMQFVLLCQVTSLDEPVELGEAVERWFWRTTFTEFFTVASKGEAFSALAAVYYAVLNHADDARFVYPRAIAPITRFRADAVRSRALALLLARRGPLDPDGRRFNAARMLADLGAGAVPKIIPAGDLPDGTDGTENRWVIHPRKLKAMRDLLGPSLDPRRDEILLSHLITREASDLYVNGDLAGFLEVRRRDIIAMEREFVAPLGLSYAESDDVPPQGP